MADTKTTTGNLSDVVQDAYTTEAYFAFQPSLHFDQLSEVKWSTSDNPTKGDKVYFTIFSDLTDNTTSINESADIDAQELSDSQVSVTLAEYGDVVTTTEKLRVTSLQNIDKVAARGVGDTMGRSIDLICRSTAQAGTNVAYAGDASSRTTLDSSDTLDAADVEKQAAKLAADDVPTIDGVNYVCIIHPEVAHDLRRETGSGSWRTPREYVDTSDLYTGEIGEFGGFRFIKTSHAPLWSDGGSGSVDAYGTIFTGFQAIARGVGVEPEVRISGPFDKLKRFYNIGWYALIGWGRMREESLRRVESASSIGSNS